MDIGDPFFVFEPVIELGGEDGGWGGDRKNRCGSTGVLGSVVGDGGGSHLR